MQLGDNNNPARQQQQLGRTPQQVGTFGGMMPVGMTGLGMQQPGNPLALLQQQQMQMLQQLTGSGLSMGGASKSAGKGTKKGRGKQKAEAGSSGSDDDDDGDDDDDDDDGDDPRNRKKLQTGGDDAERRHLALQEKNRRAQRRFRERQKVGSRQGEVTNPVKKLQGHLMTNEPSPFPHRRSCTICTSK